MFNTAIGIFGSTAGRFDRSAGPVDTISEDVYSQSAVNISCTSTRLNRLWYWLARWAPALLTDCRPIDTGPALTAAGFEILHAQEISQNTFPSAVFIAVRAG